MKYGLIGNKRVKATKGAKAFCPICGSELVANCGRLKVHHWAHKAVRNCDSWSENETEWHRNWKNNFPEEWQEVYHKAEDGQIHIADVKTEQEWVVEFQHSPISNMEQQERSEFYPKLIWIVDGTRRNRDLVQFNKILSKHSIRIGERPTFNLIYPKYCTIKCNIFAKWSNTDSLVFLDFKKDDTKSDFDSYLWLILPTGTYPESLYLLRKSRKIVIEYLKDGRIEKWYKKYILREKDQKNLIKYLRSLDTK